MSEYIELKKATISMLKADVICVHYKSGFTIEEEDAIEIDELQASMAGGREVGMLVDIYNIENKVAKSAKDYFQNKGKMLPYTKGVAIVQKGKQENLKTGFFSALSKPLYPTKTFEARKDAVDWLQSL